MTTLLASLCGFMPHNTMHIMRNKTLAKYNKIVGGMLPLSELKDRFPAEWLRLSSELTPLCQPDTSQELAKALRKIGLEADAYHARVRRSRGNPNVVVVALPFVVRNQMARLWLANSYLLAMAGGGTEGKARLALLDGIVMQRLLFRRGLERKPVSMAWFRHVWPLVRRKQRNLMLYLVQQKGIYCFYSDKLLKGLANIIGGRDCIEIAAGDGTLTRFLRQAGGAIRATDNYAWAKDIQYPDFVERLDAENALRKYAPPVVICSWPPAGNSFEKSVFACASVMLYIVIASRKTFASGNWDLYAKQKEFQWEEDKVLSGWLIPPEIEGAVLVFRRNVSAATLGRNA